MKVLNNIIIILFLISSCILQKKSSETGINTSHIYMSGKSRKFWDSNVGSSLLVNIDGTCREFKYNYKGIRIWSDYGDVELDTFKWEVRNDTLIYWFSPSAFFVYPILILTEDSLVVNDPQNVWNRETIIFVKSNDQSTFPVTGNLINPDTSVWPVKFFIKQDSIK